MTPIENGSCRKLPIPARFRDPIERHAMPGCENPDMAGPLAGRSLSMPGEAQTSPGAGSRSRLLARGSAACSILAAMLDGYPDTAAAIAKTARELQAWATELLTTEL